MSTILQKNKNLISFHYQYSTVHYIATKETGIIKIPFFVFYSIVRSMLYGAAFMDGVLAVHDCTMGDGRAPANQWLATMGFGAGV